MTKTVSQPKSGTATTQPRAFSFLAPRLVTVAAPAIDAGGRAVLAARTNDFVPALVRALVDQTIALQNRRALESGNRRPLQISVLNRRRRAARSWLQAVISCAVDVPTLHAVATQWLPTLSGHVTDVNTRQRSARAFVEFVRGAITGLLFDQPAENLLAHARALHALETVLSAHLAAAIEAVER